jgi:hypothetical protein
MARYSLSWVSITPTPTADTTNLANNTYFGLIQGGSATQIIDIREVSMDGESASTSAPAIILLAFDSTVAATVVAGSTFNTKISASQGAPAVLPVVGNSATTLPQRSVTGHLLNLGFNAYGGIMKWRGEDYESPAIYGNTAATQGEVSLSAYTGGTPGPVSGHIIYEPR